MATTPETDAPAMDADTVSPIRSPVARLLRTALTPGTRLSNQVVHAGAWSVGLRFAERLLNFARTVVLARILAPEDFGLLGIALLALAALQAFSMTGFNGALVQRKGEIRPYLDTAWTVQIIRGALVGFVLFLSAPIIAAFFGTSEAASIVRVLSLSMVIGGFANIGIVYFEKDLQFHRVFPIRFLPALTDLIAAIVAALVFRNVWALVVGWMVGTITRVLISYLIHPYRPRPRFEIEKARELFRFGRWLLGSNTLTYLILHGDDIIVGRLLGPVALGLYQMAYRISQLPVTELTDVISRVAFPAYARLQDDVGRLRRGFLETVQVTALIAVPMAAGTIAIAPDLIRVVLGAQWMAIVPALQTLMFRGAILSLGAPAGSLFRGMGKPRIETTLELADLLIIAALIFPLTMTWGLTGAGFAVAISAAIIYPFSIRLATNSIGCSVVEYCKRVSVPITSSTGMALLLMLISDSELTTGFRVLDLLTLIGIGAGLYAASLLFAERYLGFGLSSLVYERLGVRLPLVARR